MEDVNKPFKQVRNVIDWFTFQVSMRLLDSNVPNAHSAANTILCFHKFHSMIRTFLPGAECYKYVQLFVCSDLRLETEERACGHERCSALTADGTFCCRGRTYRHKKNQTLKKIGRQATQEAEANA